METFEILAIVIVAIAVLALILFVGRKEKEEIVITEEPLPKPKMRVWSDDETYIAAFLSAFADEYFFGKSMRDYANAIGRSEGSLSAKVRRLRSMTTSPKETTDIGEKLFIEISQELSKAAATEKFYRILSTLAYDNDEFELSKQYKIEEYKLR